MAVHVIPNHGMHRLCGNNEGAIQGADILLVILYGQKATMLQLVVVVLEANQVAMAAPMEISVCVCLCVVKQICTVHRIQSKVQSRVYFQAQNATIGTLFVPTPMDV